MAHFPRMKHQPSMYALVPTANPKRLTAPANRLILLSDERYWQASASDPRCILILLQRDTRALGIGQGCAARASCPKIRNHYCHANSVRIASSLRADMIFGKDSIGRPGRRLGFALASQMLRTICAFGNSEIIRFRYCDISAEIKT